MNLGFLGSSAGRESSCNTGDPGLIPGLGRYPGEGIGYSFQYFPLVAQMVKISPAIWETLNPQSHQGSPIPCPVSFSIGRLMTWKLASPRGLGGKERDGSQSLF